MIIYRVLFPNGKQYIGLTKNSINYRKNAHYCNARKDTSKSAFHSALVKYQGLEVWEIIDRSDDYEHLKMLEKKYIQCFNTLSPNGYNLTSGGDGTVGYLMTKSHRSNIAKSLTGKPGRRLGKKGKPQTESHRLKNSLVMKSIWTEKLTKQFEVYKDSLLIGTFTNQNECSRILNIKVANLNKCLSGQRLTTGGYSFRWKD